MVEVFLDVCTDITYLYHACDPENNGWDGPSPSRRMVRKEACDKETTPPF